VENGCSLLRAEGDDRRHYHRRPAGGGEPSRNGQAGAAGSKAKSEDGPRPDFEAILRGALDAELDVLARDILGVDEAACRRLGVRFVPEPPPNDIESAHYLMPELDALGVLIGLMRRYLNNTKKRYARSRCGLAYAPDWAKDIKRAILLPEGHSDVLALMTLGLAAIGRPSNKGGTEHLIPMLRGYALSGTPIVVLGENDERNGKWPGREGVEITAPALAKAWKVNVLVAYPPGGIKIKDVRQWLIAQRLDLSDQAACAAAGQRLIDELLRSAAVVEPTERVLTLDLADFAVKKDASSGDKQGSDADAAKVSHSVNKTGGVPEDPRPNTVLDGMRHLPAGEEIGRLSDLGPAFDQVVEAGRKACPCPWPCVLHLVHRDDPHRFGTVEADCRRHTCPGCGPRRRAGWLLHLMNCFRGHPGLLYAGTLQPSDWPAVKRAIQRRRGQYVNVRAASGTTFLTATVPVRVAAVISTDDAVRQLAGSLLQAIGVPKPITTSRGWALREQREDSGEYKRWGKAPGNSFRRIVAHAEKVCDTPGRLDTKDGKRSLWNSLPANWPTDRVMREHDVMSLGVPDDDPAGEAPTSDPLEPDDFQGV
jgi:hypothetical protein